MAGIYIHIPFCKKACHYCNFHFSTSLSKVDDMTLAIIKELELRKSFLQDEIIETIYIGGGTPSILPYQDLIKIHEAVSNNYNIANDLECTIEANPDDLNKEYLQNLYKHTPINRLSIGVQSFHEADLHFMNRAHNSGQAHEALSDALSVGFDNISVDLIFGNPTADNDIWTKNLQTIIDYGIPHISAYALTVEEQTALAHKLKMNLVRPIDENHISEQFTLTSEILARSGYEHYEISNYCKPDLESRHNSSYWLRKPYLGIGPSAHSYDGKNRFQNIDNNIKYLKYVEDNEVFSIEDRLNADDHYNEYVMTRLRTKWGVNLKDIKQFGDSYYKYFLENVHDFTLTGMISETNQQYFLTKKGKLFADHITSELFCSSLS